MTRPAKIARLTTALTMLTEVIEDLQKADEKELAKEAIAVSKKIKDCVNGLRRVDAEASS